jgi:hypothetical protein
VDGGSEGARRRRNARWRFKLSAFRLPRVPSGAKSPFYPLRALMYELRLVLSMPLWV